MGTTGQVVRSTTGNQVSALAAGSASATPRAPAVADEEDVVRVKTAIGVVRDAAEGRRAARLERMEAELRGGAYSVDTARLARELFADAQVASRLRDFLRP